MNDLHFPRGFLLVTLLLWGAAAFFLVLAGWSMLRSLFPYKRRDMDAFEWGRPQRSLPQRWTAKMGGIRFRPRRLAKRRMPNIAPKAVPPAPATSPAVPPKNPVQPVLALFGSNVAAPKSKRHERFVWEETKEIE
jgi:hypothetical protein